MFKNQKGFTLIELLIVIAIIAILAAIAIPQFSQYRIKGYNASALTDLRNVRTSEEALYTDWRRYGSSEAAALPGAGAAVTGVLLLGPTNPVGNETILTTFDTNAVPRGLDIAVGNNVNLRANSDAASPWGTYTLAAKNVAGDTVYGADSDSTANFRAQNVTYLNLQLGVAPAPDDPPSVSGAIDFVAPFATM